MRFKPTTRTRALVALSSVGLLALAACGGSGDTTDSQGRYSIGGAPICPAGVPSPVPHGLG